MNVEEMKKRAEEGAALAEKARSGPWMVELDHNDQPNLYGTNRDVWIALFPHQCVRSIEIEANADAAFVADSRVRVPALAADVLALIAEVERLRLALNRPRKGILGGTCEPTKNGVTAAASIDSILDNPPAP